ncbi:nuclear hormone receptor HR96-like isoform X3 [Mercenaria mercenaria]|nr:nuclear hormone receptor HR96-like isoform X3 [Mercenaria mercenaria]XP_045189325.1 nuclear hormone receptor HR96-like isoform X3 [Mercenaria mercenaria]
MSDYPPQMSSGMDSKLWASYNNCSPVQSNEPTSSTPDNLAKKREQKRRPKPKDGSSLICQICGDRALGYNFDAITCESCKAFFRRNALKTKVFTCSFEGNCKLDQHTRKFCSGCRLKKCFDVGMKKDWILSDEQLAKRRKKSVRSSSNEEKMYHDEKMYADEKMYPLQNEQTALPQQMTQPVTYMPPHKMESFQSPGSCNDVDNNSRNYYSDSTDTSNMSSPLANFTPEHIKMEKNEEDFSRPLSPELEAEIQNLEKEYASVFDSGYSEDQAKKMVEKPHNANDLFNMTDIFIRRLIKFAKHIPEFKNLKQEDQIYLLKGGIMEIMVLRSAMGFDPTNHKWKVKQLQDTKEHNIDPSIIKEQLGTGMYTEHVKFVKSLHELTLSNSTIMTLVFVIEIFSPDRPSLKNTEAVTQAQEKFTHWLQMYLESIMPVREARILYPKLLMKLLDVRNLGESSAKLASHLDITKLEPLLIEVFNLQK